MRFPVRLRAVSAALQATRSYHATIPRAYPRIPPAVKPPRTPSAAAIAEDLAGDEDTYEGEPTWSADDMEDFRNDDSTAAGHIYLQQQRDNLHYMRLIEHEMPQLVAFRKYFRVPTTETPVVVRSIYYAGEEHPATAKRVITVPVARLPLKDKHAFHKARLLAGARWTPLPPKDSGLKVEEGHGQGFIKISCEDFPEPTMNLKWASDTLDKLVAEANHNSDGFKDIPFDRRHLDAKAAKAKQGKVKRDLAGGRDRYFSPPSIRDFPKSWLPKPTGVRKAVPTPLPQPPTN